jgi:hypothetical protein
MSILGCSNFYDNLLLIRKLKHQIGVSVISMYIPRTSSIENTFDISFYGIEVEMILSKSLSTEENCYLDAITELYCSCSSLN